MTREPLMVRVDADVQARFRDFVHDDKGDSRGQLGREVENALVEYMDNDRSARVESKLDRLEENLADDVAGVLLEKMAERERQETSQPSVDTSTSTTRTQDRLDRIINDLPPSTTVAEAVLEISIEKYGGSSPKTVKKYKRLLLRSGHVFENPADPDEYATSVEQFAFMCESNDDISPSLLNAILGEYDDFLEDDWYLNALPNDYIEARELKYDEIANSRPYREKHDLLDDERGFQ